MYRSAGTMREGLKPFVGEKLPAAKTTNSNGTRRQKLKTNTPLSRDTLALEAVYGTWSFGSLMDIGSTLV